MSDPIWNVGELERQHKAEPRLSFLLSLIGVVLLVVLVGSFLQWLVR